MEEWNILLGIELHFYANSPFCLIMQIYTLYRYIWDWVVLTIVFEPRTATGSDDFARQGNGLSQIFQLIVSTSEKRLENINVVEWRQVK